MDGVVKPMRVRVRSSALLVVDIQNDFCELGFAYQRSGRDITPIREMVNSRLVPFLRRIRHTALPIVYIAANYPHGKFYEDGLPELCVADTRGAALYAIDRAADADRVIHKTELDAFSNTDLQRYLQDASVERLLISGITSDRCVRATALAALRRCYQTILLSDLVAAGAHRSREHRDTLAYLGSLPSMQIVASPEIEFVG